MRYFYQASGNSIRVLEAETGFIFGHVANAPGGKCRVTTLAGKLLALVDKMDDALPVLADYHEKHPTKWDRDSPTKYSRDTPFGRLRIEQNASGAWCIYRECREFLTTLRSWDKQAAFRSVKAAQAIADAYMRDELGKVNEDGWRWAWTRTHLAAASSTGPWIKGEPPRALPRQ